VTERPDPADTPEIAEVRRLLAEARHTEPMPDDVATRLDDVLAGLAPDAVVVPIEAHRRRRVAGLLVAAAAIVVGGITVAPHLSPGPGPSGTAAQDGAVGNTGSGNESDPQQPEQVPAPTAEANGGVNLQKGLVVVRPRHFSSDARQARALFQRNSATAHDALKVPCPNVPGPGRRVPAEYQHAPAVLVYRRAEGSAQVVDLYVCGNDRPVRSTTLPVP
jgi:hypothetical protein